MAGAGGGGGCWTPPPAGPTQPPRRGPPGPAETRLVNHSRLGEALLEMRDPPLRTLFVAANNPAVTCPDAGKVRQGLLREDLFTVVHDQIGRASCRERV